MNKHAIAGATVAVGMVLAMTACTTRESGQPHAAISSGASSTSQAVGKKAPKCRTAQLKWTLTRLDEPVNKGSSHLAVARLTATNTARHICTFDGYPWVRVFNGKAEDTVASPTTPGAVPRWMLAPGRSVRVNLRYSEARDRMGNCYLPPETSALQALAPHADPRDGAVLVPLTDTHGKGLPLNVCQEKVWMTPPVGPVLVGGRHSG